MKALVVWGGWESHEPDHRPTRHAVGGRRSLVPERTARALLAAIVTLALAGCAAAPLARRGTTRPYPAVRFGVITDMHLYDDTLSAPGPAFDSNLRSGEKLLAESRQIFEAAETAIEAEKPDFLIVCGDLTKDGELASHRLAARMLARMQQAGIPVYVVPGNHDVLNPSAARYSGSSVERVDTITAAGFAELYADYGYREALKRDPGSLSYVAEPAPGLWLLALDTCRYEENRGKVISGGRLAPATRAWAREVLSEAAARGIQVIAFLHHGIVEHFRGEKTWFGDYVLDDYDAVAELLARGGVRVAFTGHGHSQDVTLRSFPGPGGEDFIYDVETAATVSWPNAWRMVRLEPDGAMLIRSRFVTSIADNPMDFARYAEDRLRSSIAGTAERLLRKLLLSEATARSLAAQMASAGLQFFRGDEKQVMVRFKLAGMDPWGALIAEMADSTLRDLQADLPPADNDVDLALAAAVPIQ